MLGGILETAVSGSAAITMPMAFLYTVAAGILGLLISVTYLLTGRVSQNFSRTLIILPMMVCVVMIMVNGNLGTSVAVMGAFGLIRFRSLPGSSRDIGYIFFTMVAGVTTSMGYLLYGLGVTVLVGFILWLLHILHYGEKKKMQKDLRITIPENLDYTEIFDELFMRFTLEHRLLQVKTTNLGSLYELEYHVTLKEEKEEKEFLDAVRCRNGNLTVICGRTDFREEEL